VAYALGKTRAQGGEPPFAAGMEFTEQLDLLAKARQGVPWAKAMWAALEYHDEPWARLVVKAADAGPGDAPGAPVEYAAIRELDRLASWANPDPRSREYARDRLWRESRRG